MICQRPQVLTRLGPNLQTFQFATAMIILVSVEKTPYHYFRGKKNLRARWGRGFGRVALFMLLLFGIFLFFLFFVSVMENHDSPSRNNFHVICGKRWGWWRPRPPWTWRPLLHNIHCNEATWSRESNKKKLLQFFSITRKYGHLRRPICLPFDQGEEWKLVCDNNVLQ